MIIMDKTKNIQGVNYGSQLKERCYSFCVLAFEAVVRSPL